jgi:hypothetical protein
MKSRAGYLEIVGIDCAALDKQAVESFVYCTDKHRVNLPVLVYHLINPDLQ